jgi:hypothetical protein
LLANRTVLFAADTQGCSRWKQRGWLFQAGRTRPAQPATILAALVLSIPDAFLDLLLLVAQTAISMPSMIRLIMLSYRRRSRVAKTWGIPAICADRAPPGALPLVLAPSSRSPSAGAAGRRRTRARPAFRRHTAPLHDLPVQAMHR